MKSSWPLITVTIAILSGACHADSDGLRKPANSPPRELINALRNAKTASFAAEEFSIDDKPEPAKSHWHNTVRTYLKGLLGHANIRLVDSGGDITFVAHSKVNTSSATYVPQGSVGNSPGITMATGARIKGNLKFVRNGSVLGNIRFDGGQGTPASVSLFGGSNPIIAALGNSDLVPGFLETLVAARGPSMLKPIIAKHRMTISVSTDWDGSMRAYHAVFEVLARSRAKWAQEMLLELAKDNESPTAKRLAKQAMRTRNQAKLPAERE